VTVCEEFESAERVQAIIDQLTQAREALTKAHAALTEAYLASETMTFPEIRETLDILGEAS